MPREGYIALFIFNHLLLGAWIERLKWIFSLFLDDPNTCYQVRRIKEHGKTYCRTRVQWSNTLD